MTGFPSWTRYEKGTEGHRGLYPLGLEPFGAAIARRLLPGITGATIHIRYYSFLSWTFWTFLQYQKKNPKGLTKSDQQKWRIRLENIHRAATCWLYPDLTGVIGVSEVLSLEGSSEKTLSVGGGKAATPFQAAFYSASFEILRCGQQNGLVRLSNLGERLARAFDQELCSSKEARKSRDLIVGVGSKVPVGSIRSIAEKLALRTVSPQSPEHEVLVEMLFRLEQYPPNDPHFESEGRRSRCLGLLLDLTRQSKGRLKSPFDLYQLFSSGCFDDGAAVQVEPAFAAEFQAWKRFSERQHEKLGVHGIWEEVLVYLRRGAEPKAGGAIIEHTIRVLRASSVLRTWLGDSGLESRVTDALATVVRKALGKKSVSPSHELAQSLQSTRGGKEVCGTALVLLLLTLSQWQDKSNSLPNEQKRVHGAGGRRRLSLGWLLSETTARGDVALAQYVRWLVERCILDQANRVALDKLVAGQYRFFVLRDSDGYRIIRDQPAGAYLAYDSSRFPSAYRLLQGLGLVKTDPVMNITPTGRDLLKKVVARHTRAS